MISPNTERKLLAVTSGDSHKNVNNLLMALRSLHKQKRPFSFDLVLSRPHSNRLLEKIRKCISDGVRINLIQKIERENLLSLYRNSDALVFPSLFESFALPLIEARSANLPIIASERDFVREACTPIQTFDPNSSTSIANAIDRFLGVKSSENRIHDAESFLNEVVSD